MVDEHALEAELFSIGSRLAAAMPVQRNPLKAIDDKAMDALYKAASTGRQPFVQDRADQAFADGKREGRTSKEKSTSELTGVCTALLTNPASVAVR